MIKIINTAKWRRHCTRFQKIFSIFVGRYLHLVHNYVNSEYSSLYKEPLDKSEFGVIQSVFFHESTEGHSWSEFLVLVYTDAEIMKPRTLRWCDKPKIL